MNGDEDRTGCLKGPIVSDRKSEEGIVVALVARLYFDPK